VTKTFTIGPGLTCDADRLVASRLLIQANSGGGKTRTLRRLLEQSHGRLQHLVIDPEGEYHTLREQFDYVLAAPSGGDTVAHPRTAAMLAERLLQLNVSAILDIYELNPDHRVLFVQRFLDALVNAPRELWHPALIVLDEAHVYAPEGKENASTTAVKALASRGRKRGFCLVPATQRLAKLSKDVAAECNNKLIGRCTLDVDIKRAAEELGFSTNEQRLSLRHLEPGQFYAYGPAFDVKAPVLVMVGAIKTSHPEPGQKAAPVPAPTDKVKKVLQQLADLPAEAEEREKTVAQLKAENQALKREVAQRSTSSFSTSNEHAKPAKDAPPSLTDGDRALIEKFSTRLEVAIDAMSGNRQPLITLVSANLQRAVQEFEATARAMTSRDEKAFLEFLEAKSFKKLLEKLQGLAVAPSKPLPRSVTESVRHQPTLNGSTVVPPQIRHTNTNNNSTLPPGELATLTAALTYPDGLERNRLSVLTGYKRSSRDAYIARLAHKGLIEIRGQSIYPTSDGQAALPGFEPLPTGAALVEYWRGRLPEGERRTLDVLLNTGGDTARDLIDESTGYKRSSRDAYLVRMKARGIVEFVGPGLVRAAAELLDGEGTA
jgi:hypothetical protein